MKHQKNIIILVISLVVSVTIFTTRRYKDVNPCIFSPECTSNNRGELSFKTRGFPAKIQEKTVFVPAGTDSYAETSVETNGFSKTALLVNVLFWYLLIQKITVIYSRKTNTKKKTKK